MGVAQVPEQEYIFFTDDHTWLLLSDKCSQQMRSSGAQYSLNDLASNPARHTSTLNNKDIPVICSFIPSVPLQGT